MSLIRYMLLTLFCLSCEVNAQSEFVIPRQGANPVAWDKRGNPIYKLTDLRPRFPEHGLTPLIYQGTKSVEGEFKEVGFLGFCTATAVGPNVIFTAAHCVSNGQRVNWKMRGNQTSYAATCTKHPQYNDDTVFNDYAFCILDQKLPADTVFASFNTTDTPSSGWEFLLNGFGAPNLGTHYWGKANYDETQGQDIVTCGPANLGGGDSGGAFLKWSTERTNALTHWIFGTNSRAGGGCSYFNRTSHPNFKPFAEDIAKKANDFICGVTKDCSSPINPNKCVEEQDFVTYVKKQLGLAEERLKLCREI